MRIVPAIVVWLFASMPTLAGGSDEVSDEAVADGLKQVLTQSASAAVEKLGVPNGFLGNPKVKIPLPGALQKAEGVMRSFGINKYADGLITTMNRAAETATAEAGPLLLDAVQQLSAEDARKILRGGNDAATGHFRSSASDELYQKFLPVVKSATDQAGVAKKYNEFAGKGAKFGLVGEKYANIENYVTQKTLDGIYLLMAEEERAIRENPAQGGPIVESVSGLLKQSNEQAQ
ncbi:MAG TPA: DUF4197 domain-containing protein [Nitrosospira sp.]|nr:DUF4197 domain-containing protein [Nitrosospira sp.]